MSFQQWNNYQYFNPYSDQHVSYITYNDYIYFPNVTSKLLAKNSRFLYPENSNKLCVAMLITNLAKPEWITINCDEKLTTEVICYVEDVKILTTTTDLPTSVVFKANCIIKNDKCFVFHWINRNYLKIQDDKSIKHDKSIKTLSDIESFKFLFDAVSATIAPILYSDYKYKVTYQKYAGFYDFRVEKTNENSEGFVVFKLNPVSLMKVGLNTFKCEKNVLISITLLCNGHNDCPGQDPLDEIGCQCDSQVANMTQCKSKIKGNGLKICSYFLQTVNNSCHVYENVYKFVSSKFTHDSCTNNKSSSTFYYNLKCYLLNEIHKKLTFVVETKSYYNCTNGLRIHFSMVNDLVSDCGPDAEDEEFLKNVKQNQLYTCFNKNQISCRIGHPRCFNISDICTYRLDEMNHLIPCRTGEHLQNCSDFECNMLFKCQNSHCIPWGYVCDSKWDCPGGSDELEHICGSKRQCHNLYKCTQSQICVHLNDVCNNLTDCPHKEDEKYCSLNKISCPLNCQCLTFAIQCVKLNLIVNELWQSLPFHVISIKGSLNYTTLHFLKLLKFVTILILSRNDLEVFCGKLPQLRYCFALDISFNNIQMISSHCFTNEYFLEVVRLNNNKLFIIFPGAFVNLTSLHLLDLSQNLLHIFTSTSMLINSNVRELSLLNNDIKIAEFNNLRLDILNINDYRLCCLMTTIQCSAEIPWYISCVDLLGNINIKVCLYLMSSSIILLNIFTLLIRNFLELNNLVLLIL